MCRDLNSAVGHANSAVVKAAALEAVPVASSYMSHAQQHTFSIGRAAPTKGSAGRESADVGDFLPSHEGFCCYISDS